MSAQIQFINSRLSLIHIPLHLYAHFLKPIFELVILSSKKSEPHGLNGDASEDHDFASANGEAEEEEQFVNISLTPVECSIVCSEDAAQTLFAPILESLAPEARSEVIFGTDNFIAIQVDGQGGDAGQRVLDLTSPLSLAGISIFFITTYFSDYILVPLKRRNEVVSALEQQGFACEDQGTTFVTQSQMMNMSLSTTLDGPPRTPPPATLSELQIRTFTILKRSNIKPQVHPDVQIVLCAGQRGVSAGDDSLYLSLVKCFLQQPKFFSLTLTETEPPSLFMEKALIKNFPQNDLLLGNKQDLLIPITLDLRSLPLECTGIVCGVAGKLAGSGTSAGQLGGSSLSPAVEMSYLSTAMAGSVLVAEEELKLALEALDIK